MKFSPLLPYVLASLITTSLAAPHALKQPGPASVGRRDSETVPSAENTKSYVEVAAENIGFGPGEPLLAERDDPFIRSKVAELSALIKERAPGQSVTEILSRAETRLADVAAPIE